MRHLLSVLSTVALLVISVATSKAQTTFQDYNFIKSELPTELEKGVLSDPNYILVGPNQTVTGWRDRQAEIYTLLHAADSSVVAEVVRYHRTQHNEEKYICVPTNTAPPKLWEYSFRDLRDDNVFTQYFMIKAMTTALSTH